MCEWESMNMYLFSPKMVCGPSFNVVNIDPPAPLDISICQKTDYLISDGGFFGIAIVFQRLLTSIICVKIQFPCWV